MNSAITTTSQPVFSGRDIRMRRIFSPASSATVLHDFLRSTARLGIRGGAIGRRAWGAADPVAEIRRPAAAVHGGDDE
ncbi:hypothetical protein [Kitasatospora sp. MAP5-34]|uniref:hypothetical protein n=1 Tax=Kitasatospora sp. MAP5-34 TaxID=3035102 RepID=UPI0024772D6B|nr:hypothetical protein [Kitasatospora sp. MAP5-34]MDH6578654.1 hypothetical protein [Kitasatospora sp. MAP5-34]